MAVRTITSVNEISLKSNLHNGFQLTGVFLLLTEKLLDLLTNFTIGHLDIILGGAIVRHEGQEVVISDIKLLIRIMSVSLNLFEVYLIWVSYQLVFTANDIGDIHVVGRWRKIFQLLASEDVESDQVNLCVAVLASLGGGHVNNLAWATLDDDESVLSQGGTLHRVGGRGAGIASGLEGMLMLS